MNTAKRKKKEDVFYYYSMTGPLISTLNRTYALGRLTHIKQTALILSSGSPNPEMYAAPITQYKGVVGWWGAVDAGVFTVPGVTHSHSLENIPEESLKQLYEFGKSLR